MRPVAQWLRTSSVLLLSFVLGSPTSASDKIASAPAEQQRPSYFEVCRAAVAGIGGGRMPVTKKATYYFSGVMAAGQDHGSAFTAFVASKYAVQVHSVECQIATDEAAARQLIDQTWTNPNAAHYETYVDTGWVAAAHAPPASAPAQSASSTTNATSSDARTPTVSPPAPPSQPIVPASPQPSAAAAAPAAVFIICRADSAPGQPHFYNPPVDGTGGSYATWQPTYQRYLEQTYHFRGSGVGCGKYPTQAAAQVDFDQWLANARHDSTIPGLTFEVVQTNWKFR